MKYVFLVLLLSFGAFAQSFECKVSFNSQSQTLTDLEFNNSNQIKLGQADSFTVYLNKNIDNQFSIEVYDPSVPSRTYSQGLIDKITPLSYTLWLRGTLLEIKCLEENV